MTTNEPHDSSFDVLEDELRALQEQVGPERARAIVATIIADGLRTPQSVSYLHVLREALIAGSRFRPELGEPS